MLHFKSKQYKRASDFKYARKQKFFGMAAIKYNAIAVGGYFNKATAEIYQHHQGRRIKAISVGIDYHCMIPTISLYKLFDQVIAIAGRQNKMASKTVFISNVYQ